MQNGKINNVAFYSRKKLIHLGILWVTLTGVVTLNILLNVFNIIEWLRYTIMFFTLIGLVIVLMVEKARISYFDMEHRYHLLLSKQVGIVKTNCQFDSNWLRKLAELGFLLEKSNQQFSVYYRLTKQLSKRTLTKTSLLEFITIIHQNEFDFYHDKLDKVYQDVWQQNQKTNKLNKQISIQFKKYDKLSNEVVKDLTKVIAYKEGNNYLININCGFDSNLSKLYYLHSDSYAPNQYYQYAVDLIKQITT